MKIVKYESIRRLTVEAPMEERHECLDALYKQGLTVIRFGPKPLRGRGPDLNVFQAVGEKLVGKL